MRGRVLDLVATSLLTGQLPASALSTYVAVGFHCVNAVLFSGTLLVVLDDGFSSGGVAFATFAMFAPNSMQSPSVSDGEVDMKQYGVAEPGFQCVLGEVKEKGFVHVRRTELLDGNKRRMS